MTATLSATVQLVSATPAAATGRAHGWRGGTCACAGPATTSRSRCLVCAAPKINSIHHPTAAFPLLGNSDVAVSWEVRAGGPHQPPRPASQG